MPVPAPPPALTITEVGESLAAAVASIQEQLAHYPMALGTFVVDGLEVDLPAKYSVDALAQIRVTIDGGDAPQAGGGRLRLNVKPVLETPGAPALTAPQPIAALGVLPPETLAQLEAHRVYSVDDLLRVSRNAAGRRGLEGLGVTDVADLVARAEVVALPSVPGQVAESLVGLGIGAPRDFVDADPEDLAGRLRERLGEHVTPGDVTAWQTRTRALIALPRPTASTEAPDA
jgi:hypothetical protein